MYYTNHLVYLTTMLLKLFHIGKVPPIHLIVTAQINIILNFFQI